MIETRPLRDDGTLHYDDAFFTPAEADALLAELREATPWKQERGRTGPFPRMTAWYADAGLTYRYSGVTHTAIPWTPKLAEVRRRVESAAGLPFNSLLLNFYRDSQDSIGCHSDAEPELGDNPAIASISLGAVRRFVLRHIATREKIEMDLAHGSLLVMGGACQHHWLHAVPKSKTPVDARINLTFRRIIVAA